MTCYAALITNFEMIALKSNINLIYIQQIFHPQMAQMSLVMLVLYDGLPGRAGDIYEKP